MKTHRWVDIKDRGGRVSKARVAELEGESDAELAEGGLRELRESLGVTQQELARLADMAQSEISRIEGRPDVRLATLRRIVQALGGDLEVIAVVRDKRVRVA
jgi:DNA-binding XRE family transcriptional regulator